MRKQELARILKSFDSLEVSERKDVLNALYGRTTGISAVDFLYSSAESIYDESLAEELHRVVNTVEVRD